MKSNVRRFLFHGNMNEMIVFFHDRYTESEINVFLKGQIRSKLYSKRNSQKSHSQ